MERDFLGLGLKKLPVTVKDVATDGCQDSGSAMQWSFSNKFSAVPQFLSFKVGPEEKPRKTVHDPLPSSGFPAPISTADVFDSNQKPHSSLFQKNTFDKQGANHYGVITYAGQHLDAYPVHRPQQMRIFPVSDQQNQRITVSMSSPVLQSHFSSTGNNVFGNSVNSQSPGGVPVISPVSVPPTSRSFAGTTDPRNGSTSSGAPAQLTIFYAGSVCVYDDISPEKAQAIMLLAGHGSSVSHNKALSPAQVQTTIPRPGRPRDGYVANKANGPSTCSGLPGPISVTSSSASELATVKSGALASVNNQTEPPNAVGSIGPGSETLIPAVAVPQARKASLARFLEKRKERVVNTLPYDVNKKSSNSGAVGSN